MVFIYAISQNTGANLQKMIGNSKVFCKLSE